MIDYFHPQMTRNDVNAMSGLALAHVGDAVFELWVRTGLCVKGGTTNGRLHKDTVAQVCAPAQAALVDTLLPRLTEDEAAWYRRGKNAHVHGVPKNATATQYAKATGLEALVGALWLLGQEDRVRELLSREDCHAL